MENPIGLLQIHIRRGIDLAVRDTKGSDPYIIVSMGEQKLKTRVVKKNLNPTWNQNLALSITDPNLPIKLSVFDKDFFLPDKMGDAEFDIKSFVEAVKVCKRGGIPNGAVIKKVKPTRENCLAEESYILCSDNRVVQNLFLRLRNVERGVVELQLKWIDIPKSK